jgi:hypothetical protein
MSNRKPPLGATISAVNVSLNGADYPTPSISVPQYRGENLFCHVEKSGDVLMIRVDETPGNDNQAPAGASQALIMIAYRGTHVPPFVVSDITYAANASINPRLMVSSDLTDARLIITDQSPSQNNDAVRLEFLLVQEAPVDEPRYRLEWIQNPVFVESPVFRTEASIVEPSSDPGSAMGPMGLATP